VITTCGRGRVWDLEWEESLRYNQAGQVNKLGKQKGSERVQRSKSDGVSEGVDNPEIAAIPSLRVY
jgi:hypothetical protein